MLTFHLFSDEKEQFLPERRLYVGLGTSLLERLCLLSHALSILWASCLHRRLGLWEGRAEASEGLDPSRGACAGFNHIREPWNLQGFKPLGGQVHPGGTEQAPASSPGSQVEGGPRV